MTLQNYINKIQDCIDQALEEKNRLAGCFVKNAAVIKRLEKFIASQNRFIRDLELLYFSRSV